MKISAKYIVSVEGILQDSILKEGVTKEAIITNTNRRRKLTHEE